MPMAPPSVQDGTAAMTAMDTSLSLSLSLSLSHSLYAHSGARTCVFGDEGGGVRMCVQSLGIGFSHNKKH